MGAEDSASPVIQDSFWIMPLLLFVLTDEPSFSFVNASVFACFLQSVEKRFFTALSVLWMERSKSQF